ncbi:MAG: MFS transporter [Chloroflexota bacterium]|nr:MFS transporter [Chloroflexota bacterium]
MTARRSPIKPDATLAEQSLDDALSAPSRLGRTARFLGAIAKYPTFRQLWFGTMAASVGQWMQQIALGWLALELTNSPSFVGFVAFAAGIPFIVIGPPAGNLIDRGDRRRLLLVCQLFAAAVALVVALLVFSQVVQPWHLLVTAFLNGSFLSLMTPTQQSLVPMLVARTDLTNAIALMSAGQNLTRVAGPSIAGILIAWSGVGPAFVAQAAMLLVAFALVSHLRLPPRTTPATVAAGLFDGLRLILTTPALRALFFMVAISMFFVFPYLNFINVFARDILMIGATGLGVLMAASGCGAVAGALSVAARGRSAGVGPMLVVLSVLYGFAILGVAISSSAPLSAGLMFVAGFMGALVFSLNTALVQHRIRDEVRGRVMSAYFLTWGLMPLGALPMGVIAGLFGARVAVGAGALISSLLIGILGLTSREIRDL